MTKRLIRKTEYTEEYLLDGDDALDCNLAEPKTPTGNAVNTASVALPANERKVDSHEQDGAQPSSPAEPEKVDAQESPCDDKKPISEECACVVVDGDVHCGPIIDEEDA